MRRIPEHLRTFTDGDVSPKVDWWTVVSQLSSFPFLDGHCGVGMFLTRVLASRWNHVLVWDNVFCLSHAGWLLSPFFLPPPPHPGNFLMWRLRHEIFMAVAETNTRLRSNYPPIKKIKESPPKEMKKCDGQRRKSDSLQWQTTEQAIDEPVSETLGRLITTQKQLLLLIDPHSSGLKKGLGIWVPNQCQGRYWCCWSRDDTLRSSGLRIPSQNEGSAVTSML